MYLDNWKFKTNPFDSITTSESIYPSTSFIKVKDSIQYALTNNKECALITGDYGTGKTTLVNYLSHIFGQEKYYVLHISNPFSLVEDFYPNILMDLGEQNIASSLSAQVQQLHLLLKRYSEKYKRLMIIIDDAHLIDDISIIEKLRLLVDFKSFNKYYILLVMIGYLDLMNIVKSTPQLEQRIIEKENIDNLDLNETREYINFRLRAAGVGFEIFKNDVEEEIYKVTHGNPRMINTICERCLRKASELKQAIVDLEIFQSIEKPEIKPTSISDPETLSLYDILFQLSKQKYNLAIENKHFEIQDIWEAAGELITTLKTDKKLLKAALRDSKEYSLEMHSVNTAILSAYVGIKLIPDDIQLRLLVVAALLHDIGMIKIPKNIIYKKALLTNTETKYIKLHPIFGNTIIKQMLQHPKTAIKQTIAELVLQEHEREGGIGYPYNLAASQIHELSSILGICDTFESLTHSRPSRKALHPTEAIKTIIELDKRFFKLTLKQGFVKRLSFYPIGSIVQLNSGEIAEIIETNESNPIRPVIKIISREKTDMNQQEDIRDLIEYPLNHINKIIF